MPIRKFRSVEEMNQPVWREPGDPELLEAIKQNWETAKAAGFRKLPPGVHKYRSIEDLDAQVEEWQRSSSRVPGERNQGPKKG